jgi:hypothetical protein
MLVESETLDKDKHLAEHKRCYTMKLKTKNILRGVGSLIDIMPRSNFRRYVPPRDAAERMRGHWQRAGDYLRRAVTQFQNEQASTERSFEASGQA